MPNENGAADDDDDDDDAAPDMDTDVVGLKEKVEMGLIVFVAGKETGATSAPSLFIGWNEKGAAVADDDDAVPIIELNTNGADDAMSFGLCLSEVGSGALVVCKVTPAD